MTPNVWFFVIFNISIILLLVLDLCVFNAKGSSESIKKSLSLCAFWISLALLFCLGIYWIRGKEDALNFLTGYLIELSLSIDNLFIFLMIFHYFEVPEHLVHKTLFWGILGAIVMRALFIVAGIALVKSMGWILYIFAIFLIYTGFQLALEKKKEIDFEKNWLIRVFKKFIPMTSTYEESFFIRKEGRLFATPLFLVLFIIETTDVIFSIDSIPAILGITQDPLIVFTSNIFAILGLRTMYFTLSKLVQYFQYLRFGLAFILIFVGVKMLVKEWVEIPIGISLGFIVLTLFISIMASLLTYERKKTGSSHK